MFLVQRIDGLQGAVVLLVTHQRQDQQRVGFVRSGSSIQGRGGFEVGQRAVGVAAGETAHAQTGADGGALGVDGGGFFQKLVGFGEIIGLHVEIASQSQ